MTPKENKQDKCEYDPKKDICDYLKCPLHNTDDCWIDTTHDKEVCYIYVASCNGYKSGYQDGITKTLDDVLVQIEMMLEYEKHHTVEYLNGLRGVKDEIKAMKEGK